MAWIRWRETLKGQRPDLKQLLLVLTTTGDGGLRVQFRCEAGNASDSKTHVETWDALCRVAGGPNFLYVADSKLCGQESMDHLDRRKGRFETVLPRSRTEDARFRKWAQDHEPEWELVRERPNPRRRGGPKDRWSVWRSDLPSREGWTIVWVKSELLALRQGATREENIAPAKQDLEKLRRGLSSRRPRATHVLRGPIDRILPRRRVSPHLKVTIATEPEHEFRQDSPGRPGPDTRYRRMTHKCWRVTWEVDKAKIAYDRKSDGMYPLLTNGGDLTARQVLEAHKGQPTIGRCFEQLKTVHEIAPVFLKNEGRIEALFFLYALGSPYDGATRPPLGNGDAARIVERADLLTGIFGSWPSFHGAEVVRLALDRRGTDGPILEAQIHVFRMTSEVDSRAFYVLQIHTLATLRFAKVTIRAFEDFNHQIVHFALDIARRDPGAVAGLGFEVRMQSSHGLHAEFSCERVIVNAAVPWEPAPSDGGS